jgi:hypothetical protein
MPRWRPGCGPWRPSVGSAQVSEARWAIQAAIHSRASGSSRGVPKLGA